MARWFAAALVGLLPGCGGGRVEVLQLDEVFRASIAVGGKPALLWLDTGAMGSDFFLDAVASLGLAVGPVPGRSVRLVDSSGVERELTEFVSGVSYDLGPAECLVDHVVCLPRVVPPSSPGAIDVSTRVDGHLGMDVMQNFVFWFDVPHKELRVMNPDMAEELLARSGRKVEERVPLEGSATRPLVRVRIEENTEVELLLDTGADRTALPSGIAERLSLPTGAHLEARRREALEQSLRKQLERQGLGDVNVTAGQDDGSTVGLHGVATGPRSRFHLRSLRLGAREVRDLVVVEDLRSPKLGRDVLGTFEWILHGPRRELWILDPR